MLGCNLHSSFCGFQRNSIKDGKSWIQQWQSEDRAKEVVSGKKGTDMEQCRGGKRRPNAVCDDILYTDSTEYINSTDSKEEVKIKNDLNVS